MKGLRKVMYGVAMAALILAGFGCGGGGGATPGLPDPDMPPLPGDDGPEVGEPAGVPPVEDVSDFDGDGIPDAEDADADNDGFLGAEDDCNDLDPAIYPGAHDDPDAPEYTDSNCDGVDGDLAGAFWVSTDGNDANPGTIEQPFLTFQHGIDMAGADDADIKDVYVVGGNYHQDAVVSKGVGIYGGYGELSGGLRQRDIIGNETVYACLAAPFIVGFSGFAKETVVEGLTFKGIPDVMTLIVVNSGAKIMYNKIYSDEGFVFSMPVLVLAVADGIDSTPYFYQNEIVAGDINPLEEGAGFSVGLYALAAGIDAHVYPTLSKNYIKGGHGGFASAGVVLYSADDTSEASIDAGMNIIEAGDAGVATVGMMFGYDLFNDAPAQFTRAELHQNKIVGGEGLFISYGIMAVNGDEDVIVIDNFITGSEGAGFISGGISVEETETVIVNNTINAGRSEMAGAAIILNVNSFSIIANNILVSDEAPASYGIAEGSASGTPGVLAYNLFDNTLTVLYHDAIAGDLLGIDQVNAQADIATCEANILGDAMLVDQAGRDYHIMAGSIAVDNGYLVEEITEDIDGDARPQNGMFDIGADELLAEFIAD